MGPDMFKWIPAHQGVQNQEYHGYKLRDEPNSIHYASIRYLGNGQALVYDKTLVTNITQLQRYTTFDERQQWYKDRFDVNTYHDNLNLLGLYEDLYSTGDATHELWNAWIAADFYELASNLKEEDLILVGIAPADYECNGTRYPIAFVVETQDTGERFWCHGVQDWVDDMREQMRDIYDEYINE